LTAAQCITPEVPGQVVTSIRYRREASDQWRLAQGWSRNNGWPGNRGDDTALVFFNGRNDFTSGLPICEQQPNNGDQVTLVGFGCNDYPLFSVPSCTGDGPKRMGTTTITIQPKEGTITYTGPLRNGDGTAPNTGGGDSGGPYIVTQAGRICIAAVQSGISFVDNNHNGRPDFGDSGTAIAADLHNTSSRTFLTSQLPGLDCDIYEASCPARFTALYRFIYRRSPTTDTILMYVPLLRGDFITLGEITTEFRTDIFSRMQPAWEMFLEQQ
jgi:hypothetical protein